MSSWQRLVRKPRKSPFLLQNTLPHDCIYLVDKNLAINLSYEILNYLNLSNGTNVGIWIGKDLIASNKLGIWCGN